MHFKFAITESPTIEPAAASVANGDLAVAAFITASSDMAAIMTLHYISIHSVSAAWRVTAATKKQKKKEETNITGSDESVRFSHIHEKKPKQSAHTHLPTHAKLVDTQKNIKHRFYQWAQPLCAHCGHTSTKQSTSCELYITRPYNSINMQYLLTASSEK